MRSKTFVAKEGFLLVETKFIKNKEVLVTRGFFENEEEALVRGKAGAEWDYLDLFIIPAKSIVENYDDFAGMKSKPYPEPPLVSEPENPEITS